MQHRGPSSLTERYLAAVKTYLPAASAGDIVAEMADTIQSQVEEREDALGRPLTSDEESEVLRAYGPPILAASRYWSHQQLIGPLLLPYYWHTLRVVLWFVLALNVVAFLTGITTRGDALTAFAHTWGAAWISFLLAGAMVTLVFALIERFGKPSAMVERWNPRSLPRATGGPQVSRITSGAELIFNIIFALWLLGTGPVRDAVSALFLAPPAPSAHATAPLQFGPAWSSEAGAILAVVLVHALLNVINLLRPDWARLRAATFTITNTFLAIATVIVVLQRPLIIGNASITPAATAALENIAIWALACFATGLAVAAAFYLRAFLRLGASSSAATSRFGATAR
jgi:hypothetical protein